MINTEMKAQSDQDFSWKYELQIKRLILVGEALDRAFVFEEDPDLRLQSIGQFELGSRFERQPNENCSSSSFGVVVSLIGSPEYRLLIRFDSKMGRCAVLSDAQGEMLTVYDDSLVVRQLSVDRQSQLATYLSQVYEQSQSWMEDQSIEELEYFACSRIEPAAKQFFEGLEQSNCAMQAATDASDQEFQFRFSDGQLVVASAQEKDPNRKFLVRVDRQNGVYCPASNCVLTDDNPALYARLAAKLESAIAQLQFPASRASDHETLNDRSQGVTVKCFSRNQTAFLTLPELKAQIRSIAQKNAGRLDSNGLWPNYKSRLNYYQTFPLVRPRSEALKAADHSRKELFTEGFEQMVIDCIAYIEKCEPTASKKRMSSSYRWKHIVENANCRYVINGAFIIASIICNVKLIHQSDSISPLVGLSTKSVVGYAND